MKTKDIIEKMREIRKVGAGTRSYISNSYYNFSSKDPEQEWEAFEKDKSLFVVLHEPSVRRLLFYTADVSELIELSQKLTGGGYTLEVVSKDRSLHTALLEKMNFQKIAEMNRVANGDITGALHEMMEKYPNSDESNQAGETDLQDIYDLLWECFDPKISHLSDLQQIRKDCGEDEFRIIRKENGELTTLLQAVVEPKKYYFNQIINRGDKGKFYSCVCRSLKRYSDNGGKYAYAWVEKNNIASMKFFEKFGMNPDGTYTSVYVN